MPRGGGGGAWRTSRALSGARPADSVQGGLDRDHGPRAAGHVAEPRRQHGHRLLYRRRRRPRRRSGRLWSGSSLRGGCLGGHHSLRQPRRGRHAGRALPPSRQLRQSAAERERHQKPWAQRRVGAAPRQAGKPAARRKRLLQSGSTAIDPRLALVLSYFPPSALPAPTSGRRAAHQLASWTACSSNESKHNSNSSGTASASGAAAPSGSASTRGSTASNSAREGMTRRDRNSAPGAPGARPRRRRVASAGRRRSDRARDRSSVASEPGRRSSAVAASMVCSAAASVESVQAKAVVSGSACSGRQRRGRAGAAGCVVVAGAHSEGNGGDGRPPAAAAPTRWLRARRRSLRLSMRAIVLAGPARTQQPVGPRSLRQECNNSCIYVFIF